MELWLDTADINIVKEIYDLGILFGVTTNPSILAGAKQSPIKTLTQLLDAQPGLVAAQVTADSYENMLSQARELHALNPKRLIVKIPVTDVGVKAMAAMRKENIPAMATAIYTANQVLLASTVGASYVAPYLGAIEQTSSNSVDELKSMLMIIRQQRLPTKIIAAAIKDTKQITLCAELGVQAITLPAQVFSSFTAVHPLTKDSLERFIQDWQSLDNKAFL